MRVGFDIDGVIYPWSDAANFAVMDQFGVEDPGPHVHWYHLRDVIGKERYDWCWTDEGMGMIFGQFGASFEHPDGTPGRSYPWIIGVVQRFLEHPDIEVHFVTHRHPATLGAITAHYLRWMFPGQSWEGLHVLKGTDKTAILQWDAFVDDKTKTVLALADVCPAVFMPRRPWNGDMDNPHVHVYDDPADLFAVLP